MRSVIHACFDNKDEVMQAVEALLRHGIMEEDLTLILPHAKAVHKAGGKVYPNNEPNVVPAPKHEGSPVVMAAEEGIGMGIGFGLLVAMCIPGIGLIGGSGAIIASLVAAGGIVGGIAGGMYGHLIELGIPHDVAVAMADHIKSGGATLTVNAADKRHEEIILKTVAEIGGRVVASESGDVE